MPVESVYPALEPLLPQVRKPIQYVGGEVGSVIKDGPAEKGGLKDGDYIVEIAGKLFCPALFSAALTPGSTLVTKAL